MKGFSKFTRMGRAVFLLSALFIRFQRFDYFWHIGPRGVFLLVMRCERITPLSVFRCIVSVRIAYGGIEMFVVNEFDVDVFVTISSDNLAFAAADST